MGEVFGADVLEWARDLALVQRLLAGQPISSPPDTDGTRIVSFRARHAIAVSSELRRVA